MSNEVLMHSETVFRNGPSYMYSIFDHYHNLYTEVVAIIIGGGCRSVNYSNTVYLGNECMTHSENFYFNRLFIFDKQRTHLYSTYVYIRSHDSGIQYNSHVSDSTLAQA